MGVSLLLATGSLTQWSAEATGFNRHPAATDNSIPALQGSTAITYLKDHELYNPLIAAMNAARTQDVNAAVASHFVNEQKLTARDGAADVFFGTSVAVSGSTVVVGAPFDSVGGSAYVFNRQGRSWVETQKLTASDETGSELFGSSVAISGSTIVVGAQTDQIGDNPSQGSAYVFNRHGGSWVEIQRLTASDGETNDLFGNAVAISGSTILVNAIGRGLGGDVGQGSVYVFNHQGGSWVETQKLIVSDGAAGDQFGWSVAVSGSTIVVGAPFADDVGTLGQGSAFVFNRQGGSWVETQKLTASDGATGDHFGWSVATAGSTIVVSAVSNRISDLFSRGAAYVFNRHGMSWDETQKLSASDETINNFFGWSVAISGSTIVAGAIFNIAGVTNHGAAYVFNRQGGSWVETQKLAASDGAANDRFGWSVSVSDSTVVVGAPNADIDNNMDQGAAYVFGP